MKPMPAIELSRGRIEYADTGGPGPILLLLHGLLMDSSLWDEVVADLQRDHRCVVPTLPMGAHRVPIHGDLTLSDIAQLVLELIDGLDLHDVTLVGNDTGGAIVQLLAAKGSSRIRAIVLVSCDAFENFPPGLTGRALCLLGKLPPRLFGILMQQMRIKPVRRLPIAFGWLTKRGDPVVKRWLTPILKHQDVRGDTVKLLRSINAEPDLLLKAVDPLARFDGPAMIVWASDDRVMPPEHGRALARILPQARLLEISDSYTLIPLDRPAELSHSLREFTHQLPGQRDYKGGPRRAPLAG